MLEHYSRYVSVTCTCILPALLLTSLERGFFDLWGILLQENKECGMHGRAKFGGNSFNRIAAQRI